MSFILMGDVKNYDTSNIILICFMDTSTEKKTIGSQFVNIRDSGF